jgi:hypothetical protein
LEINVEQMKSRLRTILDQARLRRERTEVQELHVPTVETKPQPEPQPPPVVETAVYTPPNPARDIAKRNAEDTRREIEAAATRRAADKAAEPPDPDYFDLTVWIEERRPELILISESNGPNGARIGREILSGKFVSSYRRRSPADGDALFVLIPPKSRMKPTEEVLTFDSRDEWRSAVLNSGSGVLPLDPRLSKYDRPQRGWSLGRNSGVLRASGEIEP